MDWQLSTHVTIDVLKLTFPWQWPGPCVVTGVLSKHHLYHQESILQVTVRGIINLDSSLFHVLNVIKFFLP